MSKELSDLHQNRLELSLFLLRLGIFIVMIAWTLQKLIDPGSAARIYENYYYIGGLGSTTMIIIGLIELVIILAFLAGLWKKYSYGFVMIVHAISTLSSWDRYIIDINMLFFAAWPMLAACVTLFLLRDLDVKFTL